MAVLGSEPSTWRALRAPTSFVHGCAVESVSVPGWGPPHDPEKRVPRGAIHRHHDCLAEGVEEYPGRATQECLLPLQPGGAFVTEADADDRALLDYPFFIPSELGTSRFFAGRPMRDRGN
jgi:hypothetical protein